MDMLLNVAGGKALSCLRMWEHHNELEKTSPWTSAKAKLAETRQGKGELGGRWDWSTERKARSLALQTGSIGTDWE